MKVPRRQIEELTKMASDLDRKPQVDVALAQFGRYAEDLKVYLLKYVEDPTLRLQIAAIPELEYEAARTTLGSYFIKALSKRKARAEQNAIDQAREIASQFNVILLALLLGAEGD